MLEVYSTSICFISPPHCDISQLNLPASSCSRQSFASLAQRSPELEEDRSVVLLVALVQTVSPPEQAHNDQQGDTRKYTKLAALAYPFM
jgi:hypothetical protein